MSSALACECINTAAAAAHTALPYVHCEHLLAALLTLPVPAGRAEPSPSQHDLELQAKSI